MIFIFCISFRMFKAGKRMHSHKRDVACSIILISENAAPNNFSSVMDPQCNFKKQEYQEFHSITVVICNTSIISANVGVLLFSSLYWTFYLLFGCKCMKVKLIPNFLKIPNLFKPQWAIKIAQKVQKYPYMYVLIFQEKNSDSHVYSLRI